MTTNLNYAQTAATQTGRRLKLERPKRREYKTIPVECPICKKSLGTKDEPIGDDSHIIKLTRLCGSPKCKRRSVWNISDNEKRIQIVESAGVGSHFIRNDIIPSTAKFPYCDISWDESTYICGPVGTGKTWALAAMACDGAEQGASVRMVNWPWLRLLIIDTYSDRRDETALETINKICVYPNVLCLDDIGAGTESAAATADLYNVINKRYERNLTTHITSNLLLGENPEIGELAKVYDKRIARRIGVMCREVVLDEVI